MNREFLDFIEDILDEMDHAEQFLAGVGYDEFIADRKINYAVVRTLEIIGEATKRLPMSLRDNYPDIPWKGMAGMRDRIIHGYDIVNLQAVWDVVKDDIPHLRPQVRKILEDYSDK